MGPPVRPGYRKWPHRSAANGGREMSRWVKLGKPQAEHMSSGLPSIADMERKCWHVREVPISDSCTAANSILFDNIIGAGKQCWRHLNTERLSGLEIDK